MRYFNSAQLNIYLISVIARAKLPHAAIEKVEGTLKTQLEKLHAESGNVLTEIEEALTAKLAENGIKAEVYGREKRPFSMPTFPSSCSSRR